MKTEEMAEIIGPSIKKLADSVEIAFLFGSVATGYDDETAEKNLVCIGGASSEEIDKVLVDVKDRLSQEVVVNSFTREEFIKEFLAGKIFIRKSANAPKTFFIGEDGDLWDLYYDA